MVKEETTTYSQAERVCPLGHLERSHYLFWGRYVMKGSVGLESSNHNDNTPRSHNQEINTASTGKHSCSFSL